MLKNAILSSDRKYRYTLSRGWGAGPMVCFIGLNPSTADETEDDPTIRRCIGYAKSWGYTELVMTNLFAFRATNPKDLKSVSDPIGLLNDTYILDVALQASLVVVSWGAFGSYLDRDMAVLNLLNDLNRPVECLAKTKAGMPGHPLYLKKDLKPFLYIKK